MLDQLGSLLAADDRLLRDCSVKPLDLLAVGPLSPTGFGSNISNSLLLNALAERGHRIRAIAPAQKAHLKHTSEYDRVHHPRVKVYRFVADGFVDIWLPPQTDEWEHHQQLFAKLLRQHCKKQRPDIVVAMFEAFAPAAQEVARNLGLLSIAWARGIRSKSVWPNFPRDILDSMLEGLGRADVVVACAQHVASWLAANDIDRIVVLANGVDTRRFAPGPPKPELRGALGIGRDDLVVMHVSNLKPIKHVEELIASAAQATRVDSRLKYIIVGDSWNGPALKRQIEQFGLGRRIAFAGLQLPHAVADYLRLADLFVMTSFDEGMPRACLEALSTGLPVLASDVPGLREALNDGSAGWLYRAGDVEDLTAKTLALATDAAERARLGVAGRAHVVTSHDLVGHVDRVERLLVAGRVAKSSASGSRARS